MRHLLRYSISAIIVLSTFTGCRTVRELQTVRYNEKATQQAILKNILSEPNNPELASSLTLSTEDFTVTGQLRMRWNRSIQISANLMGLMEIARIEFLPDHLLVIDRTGRRYCSSTYSDLPYLSSIGIDFHTLQSLFWNKAFAPGVSDPALAIDRIETVSHTTQGSIFRTVQTKNSDEFGCTFHVDAHGSLTATGMAARVEEDIYTLDFDYGSMKKLKHNAVFPSAIDIILRSIEGEIAVSLELDNISTDNKSWSDETSVSSKYSPVTIEELIEEIK